MALNPGQLPTRRDPHAEQGVRLRRAEEIETLSYRTVVELNAESRLAPQRRVTTIARPLRAWPAAASERTSRGDRRQLERAARTDRYHPEPEERDGRRCLIGRPCLSPPATRARPSSAPT